MAMFLLNAELTICVSATEICTEGEYVVAWNDDKQVAIFRASEIIGCWLDEKGAFIDERYLDFHKKQKTQVRKEK